ncbi:glycoside hydrolase family 3 N-terminal domain-containing protein [Microbacterium ureisolvens]|uniref:glycoside hydrolase family 3 N-terminal domain-containing protein n=1 Tax=Microbacterium ureisolvens TaxID=2781186 RepID=UPI003640DDE1
MDVRELVPGVLLPGFAGPSLPDWVRDELRRGLGGVCLFAGNVDPADPDGTARLAAGIRAVRPETLIAADEEGGVVTRLEGRDGSTLPSPAQLGLISPDVAERVGAVLGERVRRAGIDLVLAPSADVNDNPANPVIGARSFGADPDEVAARVVATVRGIRSRRGVAPCVKHWPGHGDTDVDSHRGVPTVPAATAARHAAPFAAAIREGVPAIMTAHIVVPEWGAEPVTVNPDAIALLRADGFDGVVVTDAVDMAAIAGSYGIGGGAARALAAGVDLVCLGNPELSGVDAAAQYAEVVGAVVAAVDDGRLSPERLREAHGRVARLAAATAGERAGTGTPTSDAASAVAVDPAAIAEALAAASDPHALEALRRIGRVVDARAGATQAAATRAVPVVETLRALADGRPEADAGITAVVADRPSPAQREMLDQARAAGECVVVNVGALPGGFDAAVVQLGADSQFSAAIVRAWAGEGR